MSSPSAPADIETGGGGGTTNPNLPPEPEIGKGFLKPIPETTPLERIAGGAAVISVVTALVAMIVEGGIVVIVGGILSAVVGPYAYWQQVQLTDIKALQETQAKIQMEVDRLTAENNRLAKNIDEMTESVQGLKDVEDALEVITATQGRTVDTFAKQVETSREQLKKMQQNLQANVLSNLLELVFGSDTNQDNIVNESEYDVLVNRIKNLSGVQVHEDKFREAIVGKEVSAVIDIIKNLLAQDIPDEERIFVIEHT